LMFTITQKDTYPLMVKSGLAFTHLGDQLSGREEAFMSRQADKIPGVKRSERAYTGFLNKLRADTFDSIVTKAKEAGIDVEADPDGLKTLARFVNNATGRGDLGSLNSSAV